MATIEFVPPRGLDPWQGMALLRELVDDQTVLAWFSDMVAQEALVVTGSGTDRSSRSDRSTIGRRSSIRPISPDCSHPKR